mmetsp:Transcript_15352/g.31399  ORF Transcript_15352/g.31399 Transcript_15352/m.31399 type:complete len:599 (-) Transcript_15352:277-2073(-)
MVNRATNSASHDDILDSFLTTIESKLRGPFSSLDLAKAVSTTALRGSANLASSSASDYTQDPAREYLHNLSSVFRRTNKVIQCRMLIGLLGLNDMRTNKTQNGTASVNGEANNGANGQYLTPEILRILHETQNGTDHEDWVRTTSGLIEGVMFRTKDSDNTGNTRESCRSEEATKIIRETGMEVCEKVESQIQNVGRPSYYNLKSKHNVEQEKATIDEEKTKSNVPTSAATANKRNRGFTIEKIIPSSSQPAIKKEEKIQLSIKKEQKNEGAIEPPPPDLNACFAPYRYSLISTPILNTIIPEFNLSKEKNSNSSGINDSNCHFQVNPAANILQIDLQLEAQRAKEHGTGVPTKVNNNSSSSNNKDNNPTKTVNGGKATFLPSFRPAKLVPTKSSASSTLGATKSGARNMPKRKPGANLFNTTTKFRPQPAKTALRRRGGGAQALLKSGATASGGGAVLNKLGGGGSVGSSLNAAGRPRPGGINRLSGNRDVARVGGKSSRMKMIDDDDVDILTKLQQSNANSNMSAAELRASKRKRIASSFANQKKNEEAKDSITISSRYATHGSCKESSEGSSTTTANIGSMAISLARSIQQTVRG